MLKLGWSINVNHPKISKVVIIKPLNLRRSNQFRIQLQTKWSKVRLQWFEYLKIAQNVIEGPFFIWKKDFKISHLFKLSRTISKFKLNFLMFFRIRKGNIHRTKHVDYGQRRIRFENNGKENQIDYPWASRLDGLMLRLRKL